MALPREEPWEQGEREAEDMRREQRHELEDRFLPQEFQMWTYFNLEREEGAGTDLREMSS